MTKYYTQKKVAEMLNLSTVTINKYVQELLKELSADEKRQLFNSNNQPNSNGIDRLRRMRDEKNISFADIKSKENEELEDLKTKISELLKENENLKVENKDLQAKGFEYADKFSQLAHQQQVLQAQLSQQLALVADTKKELEAEKNKSFLQKLFGK